MARAVGEWFSGKGCREEGARAKYVFGSDVRMWMGGGGMGFVLKVWLVIKLQNEHTGHTRTHAILTHSLQ